MYSLCYAFTKSGWFERITPCEQHDNQQQIHTHIMIHKQINTAIKSVYSGFFPAISVCQLFSAKPLTAIGTPYYRIIKNNTNVKCYCCLLIFGVIYDVECKTPKCYQLSLILYTILRNITMSYFKCQKNNLKCVFLWW